VKTIFLDFDNFLGEKFSLPILHEKTMFFLKLLVCADRILVALWSASKVVGIETAVAKLETFDPGNL